MKTYWITKTVEGLYLIRAANEKEAFEKLEYEPTSVDAVDYEIKEVKDEDKPSETDAPNDTDASNDSDNCNCQCRKCSDAQAQPAFASWRP